MVPRVTGRGDAKARRDDQTAGRVAGKWAICNASINARTRFGNLQRASLRWRDGQQYDDLLTAVAAGEDRPAGGMAPVDCARYGGSGSGPRLWWP